MRTIIAIDGPLGVGKSTVAQGLAEALYSAKYYPERFEDNPYIAQIYEGDSSYDTVFKCQKLSLELALENLQTAATEEGDHQYSLVDVTPMYIAQVYCRSAAAKGQIGYYDLLAMSISSIDHAVDINYHFGLTAPLHILTDRIRQRGRDMERNLPPDLIKEYLAFANAFFLPASVYHQGIEVLDTGSLQCRPDDVITYMVDRIGKGK